MMAPVVLPGVAQAANAAQAQPQPGGDIAGMPADLLLALFTANTAPFAQTLAAVGSEARSGVEQDSSDVRSLEDESSPAVDSAAVAAPDPAIAALAAVLQWLQQHSGVASPPAASGAAAGSDDMDSAIVGPLEPGRNASVHEAGAPGTAQARSPTVAGSNPPAGALPAHGPAAEAAIATREPVTMLAAADFGEIAAPVTDGANRQPGLDLASVLRAASAATAGQVERSIPVPVHDRHWPQTIAAQVLILSDQKVQAATLRLSPEHLGPVEVRIDLQDSRVNVAFSAAHAETRAALEQAIPHLRAVLSDGGITLGQATVQQQTRHGSQNSGAAARSGRDAVDQPEAMAATVRAIGMVDEYV